MGKANRNRLDRRAHDAFVGARIVDSPGHPQKRSEMEILADVERTGEIHMTAGSFEAVQVHRDRCGREKFPDMRFCECKSCLASICRYCHKPISVTPMDGYCAHVKEFMADGAVLIDLE